MKPLIKVEINIWEGGGSHGPSGERNYTQGNVGLGRS